MADDHHTPGLGTLLTRLAHTGYGLIQNRFELLTVEWQEERARMAELLVWTCGVLFLAMMALLLLTGTIIFLFPQELRIYIAAAFTVLYLAGAIVAWLVLRSLLRSRPFAESIDQAKKDRQWLESLR